MANSLDEVGLDDHWRAIYAVHGASGELGRVVRQDRGFVMVALESDLRQTRVQARDSGPVLVGDWVVVADDLVVDVLPRKGLLSRKDSMSADEQPIAANVDTVLIVLGSDRPRKTGRIERALTQVWGANAVPIILVTKIDLLDNSEEELATLDSQFSMADVFGVSSSDGRGLDQLTARLRDKTAVMIGESGAGKSTLTNALVGSEIAATSHVRAGDAKGRHTTTRRELYVLPTGGVLIDTPGIRSLGLWADAVSVDTTFSEVSELSDECKFRDCGHSNEPGCAVLAAVESGTIDRSRYDSWREQLQEVASADLRRSEHLRRQSERKGSSRG